MDYFLSCDWGTTSFRLRLADTKNGKVLAEERSGQGISNSFNLWSESGRPDKEKIPFYLNIIKFHINRIEEKIGYPLNGAKLIISGMASSSIGFIDIPYNSVPLIVDGSAIKTASIPANKNFDHDVLIISGIRTNDDVMRGEETQLIGCIDPSAIIRNELYVFPGTHSKHIRVKDNHITGFKTYMTGEFFELLSQKSILKSAVEREHRNESVNDLIAFKMGVKDAMLTNLLHSVFKVRTNHLFDLLTKQENFNYLSGLLIGTELKDLKASNADMINLLCGSSLEMYYRIALQELGISNVILFPPEWVDEATVRGHHKIGKQLKILA
jgi:2-dehydro-3-deoxygalactonokinase